uniref:Uncharacterized protein n=1 Tax=Knipowitschia caucasica TaxID=637954 RepID=A0AAV2MRM0_KNICA
MAIKTVFKHTSPVPITVPGSRTHVDFKPLSLDLWKTPDFRHDDVASDVQEDRLLSITLERRFHSGSHRPHGLNTLNLATSAMPLLILLFLLFLLFLLPLLLLLLSDSLSLVVATNSDEDLKKPTFTEKTHEFSCLVSRPCIVCL